MWNTIVRVFGDRDLRRRILVVVGLLVIFRFVVHIPIPGINAAVLSKIFAGNQFLGLIDLFTGGSLSNFSIAMMGVAPYINASIIMQLMTMAVPSIEALSKEGDFGQRKLNQYTRYLTVPLALLQSYGTIMLLQRSNAEVLGSITPLQLGAILLTSTAGTIFLMWLGELISEQGIGNGISLIIFVGIISRMPSMLSGSLLTLDPEKIFNLIIFALLALVTVFFVVYITEGQRQIPVAYGGKAMGNRLLGSQTTYLPLRVNMAGVIPIIFALSLLLFPGLIASFFVSAKSLWLAHAAEWTKNLFQNQVFYGVFYFILVAFFTYFYTWVVFKPDNVAENIQKQGGFIPGLRPGRQTVNYLSFVINRITLAGAIFLGFIAVLPLMVQAGLNIANLTLGGTSLLIVVSVALETLRQIEAQLTMRRYEGV